MKRIFAFLCLSLVSLAAMGAKIDTLRISQAYTTHIIFATDLTYADLSNSRVVAGKIIEQNKNMLALKAREPFMDSSSVSALESNGTMHTFIIVYDEHPANLVIDLRKSSETATTFASPTARYLQEIHEKEGKTLSVPGTPTQKSGSSSASKSPGSVASTWKTGRAPLLSEVADQSQHLYHIGCREYDIQVLCEDISSYNDITYVILSLRNQSGISYEISDATFVVESKGRSRKRTVKLDKTVFPRNRHGKLSAAPGEYTRAAYSFDKLTLSKDQELKVYVYENNGQRNLVMTISAKDINKARTNI